MNTSGYLVIIVSGIILLVVTKFFVEPIDLDCPTPYTFTTILILCT